MLGLGLVLLWATTAAAIPAVGCGQISVHGKRYSVRAHVMNCHRARQWAISFLAVGHVPVGYDCQRFSPRITRVRFVCDNPATATRVDGPQSFSATR